MENSDSKLIKTRTHAIFYFDFKTKIAIKTPIYILY